MPFPSPIAPLLSERQGSWKPPGNHSPGSLPLPFPPGPNRARLHLRIEGPPAGEETDLLVLRSRLGGRARGLGGGPGRAQKGRGEGHGERSLGHVSLSFPGFEDTLPAREHEHNRPCPWASGRPQLSSGRRRETSSSKRNVICALPPATEHHSSRKCTNIPPASPRPCTTLSMPG